MYQLKIDITDNNYLTQTEYEGIFQTIELARKRHKKSAICFFGNI